MNLDPRSLSSLFEKALNVSYDSDQGREIFDAVVEHFVLSTPITQFHKKLDSLVDFKNLETSASQFRVALGESGQVIFNLRYYACFLSNYHGLNAQVAEEYYTSYDLCRCDAVRIYQAVKKLRTTIKAFCTKRGYNRNDFSVQQFDAVRFGFDKHYTEILKFIRIKTKRKLRFVYQFNNMDRRDFHAELLICALRAYYKLHPCRKSDEYVLNYMRSTVNNKIVNLIEYYTTEKRQTLVSFGDADNRSYQLNVVAESQMSNIRSHDSEGEEIPIEHYYDESVLTKLLSEFDYSVDRWLKKFKGTHKAFILSVFIGREVETFTSWLRSKRVLRANGKNSQDFIASKSRSEVIEIVGSYIERDEKFIMTCLREAAHELGVSV